jgi:hypothetical protein
VLFLHSEPSENSTAVTTPPRETRAILQHLARLSGRGPAADAAARPLRSALPRRTHRRTDARRQAARCCVSHSATHRLTTGPRHVLYLDTTVYKDHLRRC